VAIARGESLGRYVILETLGHGGMGTVVKAYDETLDRAIAIKLLRAGTTDRHARRLRREALALARLSHPNVVHVYDVDRALGQWFIAMELVPGRTLRQWSADAPGWRACVEAYLKAGEGLVAAHAAGLVHRDFKPDNCIIDDQGWVRVLDFGLVRDADPAASDSADAKTGRKAKSPDLEAREASMTHSGVIMGTVAYMPPEQFDGGRADARSDQFSFCVSLYEAVYGERPFEGVSIESLMDAIQRGDVRPPPRGRTVPPALRSVLLRGLAADPRARWPSMGSLLSELRRRVAPPRRRWMAVGVAAGLVAVGGGVALGQYAQVMDRCTGARTQLRGVWDEGRRRQLEATILGTGTSYAPDTWVRIEQRLDDYADDWASKHAAVCEATRVTQEQTEADMGLRMSCLHDRKVALRAAVDVLADADATVVEHAVKLVAGLPGLDRCDDRSALRAAVPPPEDPEIAHEVAVVRDRLVALEVESKAGRTSAEPELQAFVEQAEATEYEPLVAEVTGYRGAQRDVNGRYAEAEQDLLRAYALAMQNGHDAVARDAARRLIRSVGLNQARHAEGLVWGRVALAHVEREGEGTTPEHEAGALKDISDVLSAKGALDEALDYQQRALAVLENARGQHDFSLASLLDSIGIVLARKGSLAEGLTYQRRALAIFEQTQGEHHPYLANILNNMSVILRMQGELDASLSYQRRALAIWEGARGPRHPSVAAGLNNIGGVLAQQGKLDEALDDFLRALSIREEMLGEHHPEVADTLNNIGNVTSDQGKLNEALTYYRRALAISEEVYGEDHARIASLLSNIGVTLYTQGKLDEALVQLERALVIYEKTVGEDHPDQSGTLNIIGRALIEQGRADEALVRLRRALAIGESALGTHTRVASTYNAIGIALHRLGERDEAKRHHLRALEIWEDALGEDHPELANALIELSRIALEERDFDTARAQAERAVTLREAGQHAAADLAEARFVLARSLWTDRVARARARTLARAARETYERLDATRYEDERARVEQWLGEHRSVP